MTNYKPKIGQPRRNGHVLLLETYSPSKRNHKDVDNLKRLINRCEIEFITKIVNHERISKVKGSSSLRSEAKAKQRECLGYL